MSAGTTRFLLKHSILGGLALVVAGAFFVHDTLSEAREVDALAKGPQAEALVMSIEPAGEEKFALELFWTDPDGSRQNKVKRSSNSSGLEVGDRVPIVLDPSNYSSFAWAERVAERQAEIVEVAGIRAVNTVFIGIALVIAGVFTLIFHRHIGADLRAEEATTAQRSATWAAKVSTPNVRLATSVRVIVVSIVVALLLSFLTSITPRFQYSTPEEQGYLVGRVVGSVMVVSVIVLLWGLVSGNEWSWGGSFVRMVVVVLILAAINAAQARSMLDRPDSAPDSEGPALVKRP